MRRGGAKGRAAGDSPPSPRDESPREDRDSRIPCGLRFYLGIAIAATAAASIVAMASVIVPGGFRLPTNERPSPPSEELESTEDAPQFAHDDDPVPFYHEERFRPFAGRGCTFRTCNAQPGKWRVAGKPSKKLPLTYLVVPHRNRLDNLVRLLSSLNNATSPAQRACLCVIITDFNTSTASIAPWKNSHCLVSYRSEHNIWMDDEAFYRGKQLTRGQLREQASTYASAPECPDLPPVDTEALKSPARGGWRSVAGPVASTAGGGGGDEAAAAQAGEAGGPGGDAGGMVAMLRGALAMGGDGAAAIAAPGDGSAGGAGGSYTYAAFPPLHVDVAGLTGRQALRYALAFYDGESAIVDGNAYVHNPKTKFSRAGGIMGGLDAIATPTEGSLVFVCDADVIIRPGFMEEVVDVPVQGRVVFYPILWSMCWGTVLDDAPKRSNWRSSQKGAWRPGGTGMVAAYLSDLKAVGGMRELINRNVWGQEDILMWRKVERKFNITRRAAPYLVHMYHSRVKDWSKSEDGISMGPAIGPLGKHVCVRMGSCSCPPGTGPRDVEKAIWEELNLTVKII